MRAKILNDFIQIQLSIDCFVVFNDHFLGGTTNSLIWHHCSKFVHVPVPIWICIITWEYTFSTWTVDIDIVSYPSWVIKPRKLIVIICSCGNVSTSRAICTVCIGHSTVCRLLQKVKSKSIAGIDCILICTVNRVEAKADCCRCLCILKSLCNHRNEQAHIRLHFTTILHGQFQIIRSQIVVNTRKVCESCISI